MQTDPDIQIMLRCRDGDEEAFRILFVRHKKKVINFCYRFCSDRSVAEDLAQEVFLRIYRAAPKYKPTAGFRTWLFTIATNVCLNETRRRRKQAGTISLDAPIDIGKGEIQPDIEDPERLPDDQILDREQEVHLQSALSELPDRQRAALLLRITHDFSYSEIAGQLGCSENTVKTLIHRGRMGLSDKLMPYFKGRQ